MITLGARWRMRGSVATAAGLILILVGVVTAFAAFGGASNYLANSYSNFQPVPSLVPLLGFALAGLATIAMGIGVFLVIFARSEVAREESLRLDPLSYPPYRHPVRWALLWAIVAMVIVLLPNLAAIPVEYSYRAVVPVEACTADFVQTGIEVHLPSKALLTYSWSSADGRPVSVVWAPTGPPIVAAGLPVGDAFYNSSYGYSAVQSNGSAIPFWACDYSSSGEGANRTVVLTGSYYATLF